MNSKYHALTIAYPNGRTYWQLPHDTEDKAKEHALKHRKNSGWILIFEAKNYGLTTLVSSLNTRMELEQWDNMRI